MKSSFSGLGEPWSVPFFVGCLLLFAALHGVALPVAAQTVTASNGLTCAGARAGGSLNCTAGEFTATVSITKAAGTPDTCISGEYIMLDGSIGLSDSNANRYNIGFFAGEDGNDPKLTTGSCSVATFPTSPSPWLNLDGNACGDYLGGGVSTPLVQNLKVLCVGNALGQLQIPYVLTYAQNTNTCTGPSDVQNGAPSKCNAGTATVGGIWVLPAISVTDGKSTVTSGEDTTYTVVITNNSGATMTNLVFKDPLVSGIGVGGVSCSASGATCPASSTVAGMQGAGLTIPSISNGGSVTFTITATLSGSVGATLTNVATVALSGGQTAQASDSNTIVALVPLAEYRFDECSWTSGTSGAVTDSTGSYHGTPYSVTTAAGGVVQRAADLSASGTADYIKWPVALLSGRSDFTTSLWFKTSTSQAQQEILHGLGSSAGDDEIEIYLINTTQIRVNLFDAGNTYTAASSFVDGGWHHLAVTRSGTSVCVFLDATALGCNTRGSGALSITNADALLTGQEQDAFGGSFADNQSLRAQLDEFKVFGSALSSTQISNIRANELAGNNHDGTVRPLACVSGQTCEGFESGLADWTVDNVGGTAPYYGTAVIDTTRAQTGSQSLRMSRDWVRATSNSTINTTGATGSITFGYGRGLNGSDYPEPGDDMQVEYLSSSNAWTTLTTINGVNSSDTSWQTATVALPANAKHSGFKIRFTQILGSGNASNDYDQWNIDNVCVPGSALPSIDHLRIEHGGSGVTCAPTTLTIKACADADCTSLYTGGVTGTLTVAGGPTANWVGGSGFSIDATGSTTKQVQVATAGTVAWGTTSESPTPGNATACYIGATASCGFTSALAGVLFDVPNHYSDVQQSVTVSAVKQSDDSLACTPAFASTSKTVSFNCGYSDPASGTLPVTVGGSNISCGSASGVSLAFNASGVATTTVRYADVGQMSLTASYTGTSGSETGLVMSGSDPFIAAPASFTVTPTGPYVAGTPFSVTVTAKNASGNTTPNFGAESTTENVSLGHTLTGPVGGNNPALEGTTTLADATFDTDNGVATAGDIEWDEVGDISLTATLDSASYLGSGLSATGAAAVGPFKPAYFDTAVTPGTGTFTYAGQPFTVTVTAMNADGATTQNYEGAYAKAVTLTDANSATNNSGTLGAFSNATIAAASFADGVATASTIEYDFTTKTTAPLETPASAPLALRATDTDAVTSSGHTEGTTPIRAGRLRLVNFYGSELLAPRVEYRAEYWDGNRWTANTLDSTTAIVADNIAKGGLTVNDIGALTNGVGFITFATAGVSSHDIAFNLNASGVDTSCNASHPATTAANLPWLQGYWSGSCGGTAAWQQDPSARIRLGSPKAPYIYLRERY